MGLAIGTLLFQGFPSMAEDDEARIPTVFEIKNNDEIIRLEPLALVRLVYGWTPGAEKTEHELDIKQARVGLNAAYAKMVEGEVQIDGADPDILFAAWMRVRFADYLKLRAGLFKRPFYKLRMRSIADVEVIDRGTIDSDLKDGMDYTAQKTGAELEGTLAKKLKLKYRLGFFSDFAASRGYASSNDLVALLSMEPIHEVELGAAGEMKFLTNDNAFGDRTAAGDLFVGTHVRNWDAWLEGVVGQDPRYEGTPLFVGGIALVAYTIDVVDVRPLVGIRPVLRGEIMEPDTEVKDDLAWRVTAGMDFLFVYNLRIGLDAERIEYDRNNRDGAADDYKVLALVGWAL